MRVPHRLPYPTSGSSHTPQDKITIIAQCYAGFFTGHPYRFDQQSQYQVVHSPASHGIHVEKKAWKEPVVIADDCEFCQRLTDEQAISRVEGFQHQLDIEILRLKAPHYTAWLLECGPDVIDRIAHTDDIGDPVQIGLNDSALNRRSFIRTHQDVPFITAAGEPKSNGWSHKALPLVDLPLRLKRKMCIEWNHVYTDYLAENPTIIYDFKVHAFFEEKPDLPPSDCCGGKQAYTEYGGTVTLHENGCASKPTPLPENFGYGFLGTIMHQHGAAGTNRDVWMGNILGVEVG